MLLFIVETDEVERVASVDTDEWGSHEDVQEGAEMEKQLAVHCVESDEEEESPERRHGSHASVSETTPKNMSIIDSTDQKPLRQIAAEAF